MEHTFKQNRVMQTITRVAEVLHFRKRKPQLDTLPSREEREEALRVMASRIRSYERRELTWGTAACFSPFISLYTIPAVRRFEGNATHLLIGVITGIALTVVSAAMNSFYARRVREGHMNWVTEDSFLHPERYLVPQGDRSVICYSHAFNEFAQV